MMKLREYKAGTELAAWFENRFSKEILQDVHSYIDAFNQYRTEAKSAKRDDNLEHDVEEWLQDTPGTLSHSFTILAPESAYANTKINLLVIAHSEDDLVVGHYSTIVGRGGKMPAEWEEYAWNANVVNGLPWPTPHLEDDPYLPTPQRGTLDKASSFLDSFFDKTMSLSDRFYEDEFEELFGEVGSHSFAPSSSRRPDVTGRKITKKNKNRFISSRKAGRKKTKRNIKKAYRNVRKQYRGKSVSKGRSTRRQSRSRRGKGTAPDDDKMYDFIDNGATPYPAWFEDLELLDRTGSAYDTIIREYCLPILRSLIAEFDKRDEEIKTTFLWHVVEQEMYEDGLLDLTCSYKSGRFEEYMDIDEDGYCTCTKCGINPHYGNEGGIYGDLAQEKGSGRCKKQGADLANDFERQINNY